VNLLKNGVFGNCHRLQRPGANLSDKPAGLCRNVVDANSFHLGTAIPNSFVIETSIGLPSRRGGSKSQSSTCS